MPGRKRGPAKSPVPPLPEGVQGAAAAAATAEAEGQGDEETESDDELIVEMSDDDL